MRYCVIFSVDNAAASEGRANTATLHFCIYNGNHICNMKLALYWF